MNKNNIAQSDRTKLGHLGRKVGLMFVDDGTPYHSPEFAEAALMYSLCLNDRERHTVVYEFLEGVRQHIHMAVWEVELLLATYHRYGLAEPSAS